MKILMIANSIPYPMISGDRIRNYNLLRGIANLHEVSLAAFIETQEDLEGIPHLRQFCSRVEIASFQQRSRLAKLPDMLRFALQGKPPELSRLHSQELVEKLRQLVAATDFDIVMIDSRMGLYLETLPQKSRCKSILMFQNFTFQQGSRIFQVEQRWGRKVRALLDSIAMRYWEPHYAQRFDCSTTVSEIDKSLLLQANPRLRVDVIPNGVDTHKYEPLVPVNDSPTLLFIGNMGYPPCADAAQYFCQEIFPQIRRTIGAAELWIVGRDPRPEVLELANERVHVTGQVKDVIPYYQQCAVCVVPLRAGGGTRLKILEAMALGRPVVTTSIGCEGLDVVNGKHLLIADTPEQFAKETVRLLTDRQLYQSISEGGRQLVEKHYDWEQISGRLVRVCEEILAQSDVPGMRVRN